VTHVSNRTNVLLIEDNPDDAEILRELLAEVRAPVRLTAVESLRQAEAALAQSHVDLILLDLSLPDSQGLATVERALAAAPRIPILVLTGLEDEVLGAAAVHAGAQDYLVKGQADGAALVRAMRYAGERHRLLAARTEDAHVWSTLARCGEVLLGAAGSGPAMLDALGGVAADALGCAASSIWMLDHGREHYAAVAARPRSEWQRLEGVTLPVQALRPFVGGPHDAARWLTPALRRSLPAPLLPDAAQRGDALYLAFVRGGDLEGLQVCRFPGPPPDAEIIMRIASGLVHVAGLALGNARLIDELERSNTVKTYFAATMSHELRNTLFAIGGFGDMLAERYGSDVTDAQRLARTISDRARQSLALIQAALELTRSEVRAAGEATPIAVADLFEQLALETHVADEKPELRIEWSVDNRLPPLRSDAVKLSMILKNLIANAVKFSERGCVRVAAEASGDRVRFVVADSGIGIEPDELPHLFQPFRQAHGSRSRRAGGAGLGLYIVGRLVELLEGQITVESVPGSGTTFQFTIPQAPALPTPAAAAD
jgi:signal transduction histidine kinase/CheY-like chemotaxis protein